MIIFFIPTHQVGRRTSESAGHFFNFIGRNIADNSAFVSLYGLPVYANLLSQVIESQSFFFSFSTDIVPYRSYHLLLFSIIAKITYFATCFSD